MIRHAPTAVKKGFLPEDNAPAVLDSKKIKNLALSLPANCTWHVSPLKRTVQTADALSAYITAGEILVEESLKEQNFGDWSGEKISDVWEELKQNKNQHNYSFICPETSPPNGENFLEQCKRVSLWLENTQLIESTSIVITHSGTIRAILSHILKIEPDIAIGINISHLKKTIFEIIPEDSDNNRGGRFRLLGINE